MMWPPPSLEPEQRIRCAKFGFEIYVLGTSIEGILMEWYDMLSLIIQKNCFNKLKKIYFRFHLKSTHYIFLSSLLINGYQD
jgi:hypothetical protein